MTIPRLRLVVVGCGYITQAEHVPALLTLQPEIKVVAAVDPEAARAEAIARVFRAASFASLEAALASCAFDAVLIATPAPSHVALIATAARAEKHILVEKPIAYSLAEAREAIASVTQSRVHCMVAYHRRYDDDCLKVRDLIASGSLGEIKAATSLCRLSFPSVYRSYAEVRPTGVPPPTQDLPSDWLAENSIHHLNLMRFWLGDVTAVHAAAYSERDHNLGIVTLSFGRVLASHHQLRGMECGEEISLYGSEASVHVELWYPHRPYRFPKITVFSPRSGTRTELIEARNNPYTNEIRHFAALLAGEAENRSTLEDSYKDLEAMTSILDKAIYTSER
jgi:predicted dehydrogenase